MNFEDYETLPTNNIRTHMMAGAMAGIMEHCVMYPLDSVKTRMQSLSAIQHRGIRDVLVKMVTQEGILRPVRGMGVVVMSAGPAHSLYFSCYEFCKEKFTHTFRINNHVAYGLAGCIATVLHDGLMTPADVVKQRLQMYGSPYRNFTQCVLGVYRTEGLRAFYRSYTTQLAMNVPFQSIHFIVYEAVTALTNPTREYNPIAHMISGAVAGGTAASITTPLDVCKTLLNTQHAGRKVKVSGLLNAVRTVYSIGGPLGFFRGMSARVLYTMPSTAICWSTYEFFKYLLTSRTVTSREPGVMLSAAVAEPGGVGVGEWGGSGGGYGTGTGKVTTQLPAVSGAGLYGALSFTTLHSSDSQTNNQMDITRR